MFSSNRKHVALSCILAFTAALTAAVGAALAGAAPAHAVGASITVTHLTTYSHDTITYVAADVTNKRD